jgi:hypothetical protein
MIYAGIYNYTPNPAHKIAPAFKLLQGFKHLQHGFVVNGGRFICIAGIPDAEFHHTGIATPVQFLLALRVLLFTTFYYLIPV